MKSYISRKFPLETRSTDQNFAVRLGGTIVGSYGLREWLYAANGTEMNNGSSHWKSNAIHSSQFAPCTREAIAPPSSSVVARPPMSGVRTLPCARTSAMEFSTVSAASQSPRCRNIIAPDHICPIGLAIHLPALSGAEP